MNKGDGRLVARLPRRLSREPDEATILPALQYLLLWREATQARKQSHVLSGFFHLPAFGDALANMRSFLTSNVVPHEHRDDTRWIRKHVRVFSVFDRRAHLKWIAHVSYNDYGYNPYDEPDCSSHPNSDFISRSDDTGDGVVGGYYWSDSGSWVSLPDDRDYGGGGYAPARKKPEPEPTPGLRETSTKLA